MGDSVAIAISYLGIGNVYFSQGNYPEALRNFFATLKIMEKAEDKYGIASSHVSIANVYFAQKNFDDALKNHFIALKIRKEINDKRGIAASYNNIGNLHSDNGNFTEAISNLQASLKIKEDIGDEFGIATSYHNIGSTYFNLGNHKAALKKYFNSLKKSEELGDKPGIARTCGDIGAAYFKLANITTPNKNTFEYTQAEIYSLKSYKLASELKDLETISNAANSLSQIYQLQQKYSSALIYYKNYISTRDSLFNEANTKQTVRLEMNFDFEKKEAATKLEQEKKEAVAAAESKKQKIIIWAVCGILILVFAFAAFAYRSYLQKQKANKAIIKQKEIIEEKQKEIIDSICEAYTNSTSTCRKIYREAFGSR